jgi:hypothetical protein
VGPLQQVVVLVLVRRTEARHTVDHGDVDPRLAALGVVFVVLGKSPLVVEPTEGPFHDPAPLVDLELALSRPIAHDLQRPAPECVLIHSSSVPTA